MARNTHDREDLVRDGTQMPIRGRLWIEESEVVLGFRSNNQLSIYWDQDPVFQFDHSGRLRRAFVNQIRLKSENGKLMCIQPGEIAGSANGNLSGANRLRLNFVPLNETQTTEILQSIDNCLGKINQTIGPGLPECNQVIPETDVVGASPAEFALMLQQTLQMIANPVEIADSPEA